MRGQQQPSRPPAERHRATEDQRQHNRWATPPPTVWLKRAVAGRRGCPVPCAGDN